MYTLYIILFITYHLSLIRLNNLNRADGWFSSPTKILHHMKCGEHGGKLGVLEHNIMI